MNTKKKSTANKAQRGFVNEILSAKMIASMNRRLIENQVKVEELRTIVDFLILMNADELKRRLYLVRDPKAKPIHKLEAYAAVRNRQKRERFHRVSR